MSNDIERLSAALASAHAAVVFTGAGISTESGISDFRSPGGVWSRMSPIDFHDFVASEDARRESWRRKIETDREMLGAQPNRGHRSIASLVARGCVATVITQNIDGLHQKSGIPDHQIIELHGNATYAHCLDCNTRYELEPIKSAFQASGALPHCTRCSGIVKTATVSFGQPMPALEMERAEQATRRCDLFIAIGSSLVVYPAAAFPANAKAYGARLAIINREPTGLDSLADLLIHAEIGGILGAATGVD